jgi:hypothetical protein
MLDNDIESRSSKLRRLIMDVFKNPDSPIALKDRIKLLFKVEGLTIGAIITAVIITFTTLGLSISHSLKPKPTPPGPTPPGPSPTPPEPTPPGSKPKPSIPDRVKEGLEEFVQWLKELAKKLVTALPGIIGSVVSFILKGMGELAFFAAQHVIFLIIAIVSTIIFGLTEGVTGFKKYRPPSASLAFHGSTIKKKIK